jgi:hypothetical protein
MDCEADAEYVKSVLSCTFVKFKMTGKFSQGEWWWCDDVVMATRKVYDRADGAERDWRNS